MSRTRSSGSAASRAFGTVVLTLVLLGILVPITALAFSVSVRGSNMEPTLHEGDRLFVNFLADPEYQRFDLVDARLRPDDDARSVVRVIGVPGDRIRVEPGTGGEPLVSLVPEGNPQTFTVVNPSWNGQAKVQRKPCCDPTGRTSPKAAWVTIPPGHYWLISDNWDVANDSRVFGFVEHGDVGGALNFRLLPISKMGRIPTAAHLSVASPTG